MGSFVAIGASQDLSSFASSNATSAISPPPAGLRHDYSSPASPAAPASPIIGQSRIIGDAETACGSQSCPASSEAGSTQTSVSECSQAGSSQSNTQSSSQSSSSSSSSAAFAEALQATNLLNLLSSAHDGRWLRKWDKKMRKDLPKHSRDCMGMAGKLPLALKALDAGISPQELLVDCAQAGGLHGKGDGSLVAVDGRAEGIEIKGAGLKRGKKCSFAFKGIRVLGTSWKHLFLLGRESEPVGWSTASDVDGCMWLGYVGRDRYTQVLRKEKRSMSTPQDATVTPGSSRSWLGGAVEWVRLKDLTRKWWDTKVLGLAPAS